MEKKSFLKISQLCILPLGLMYLEFILANMSGFDFSVYRTAGVLLAVFGAGLLVGLIFFCIKKPKLSALFTFIILEICTVFFLIEFFANEAFTAFMSIESIFTGAGGIVTDFSDVVSDIIKHGIGTIFIFHIPAIIALIITIKTKNEENESSFGWKFRLISLVLAAGILTSGIFTTISNEQAKEKYTYDYIFDSAVRNFGLSQSVWLECIYAASGIPNPPVSEIIPEETHQVHSVEYNQNDIDFEGAKAMAGSSAADQVFDYMASRNAEYQNEYTGLLKDKNVVIIAAESFSKELLTNEYSDTLFPLMKHMANSGIVVEDYYHPFWGGSTTSGETAILTGMIPMNGAQTMQKTVGNNNGYTLAPILTSMGYTSVAYHNGDYDYYNRDITHPSLGFSKFIAFGNGMEESLTDTWPRSDLEMFRFIDEDIQKYDKYYAYIMSFSGHGLYNFTGNRIAYKNRDYLKDTALYDLSQLGGYEASSMDLELGLEYFTEELKKRGELDNTVFVITTDHYAYALQKGDAWKNDRNYLDDLFGYTPDTPVKRDHTSLIIWSPCLEELNDGKGIHIEEPCSAIDILPTLLNLLGTDFDSRIYPGRDILGKEEAIVIWANSSWLTNKGFYDAATGKFTANENAGEVSENYILRVKDIVRNRVNLSRNFINLDLYQYIQDNTSYPMEDQIQP